MACPRKSWSRPTRNSTACSSPAAPGSPRPPRASSQPWPSILLPGQTRPTARPATIAGTATDKRPLTSDQHAGNVPPSVVDGTVAAASDRKRSRPRHSHRPGRSEEDRVAHVELSLSGAFVPQARTPAEAEFVPGVDRWTATVAAASEPCLIIDTKAFILAVSVSAAELLGLGKPPEAIGQRLASVLHLLDFTAGAREVEESDADKIPPLMVARTERL